MFDSPRPAIAMSPFMTGATTASPHHRQPLLPHAAMLVAPAAGTRRMATARLRRAAMAAAVGMLVSFPSVAHAAKHTHKAKTPVEKQAAAANSRHRAEASKHAKEARSAAKEHRQEAAAHAAQVHHTSAVEPHGRHARGTEVAEEAHGRHTKHSEVAAESHDRHRPATEVASEHVSRRVHLAGTRSTAQADAPETAANDSVEARVHAWYQQHSIDTPAPAGKTAAAAPSPAADLSPEPRTATVEDFDRAAEQQARSLREAAARTSAADDAASADATHIPSTAPTERVPAPFQHVPSTPASAAAPAQKATPTPAPVATPQSAVEAQDNSAVERSAGSDGFDDSDLLAGKAAPAIPASRHAASATRLTSDTDDASSSDSVDTAADAPDPALAASPSAPAVKVNLYDARGRLLFVPPMKGSHEILVHQNLMAAADGLNRIADDSELASMRRNRLLAVLPDTDAIYPDDRLPANRRYARPWTVRFLNDLARAHYARFGTPIVVTSAVRTVEFQRHLIRVNGNAAPPTGDVASPHLYGQAVDIAKHGMSTTEIMWMRAYLTPVEASGKLDVEEEFQQSCFHISVYRRYLGAPKKDEVPAPPARPAQTVRILQARSTAPSHRHHLSTAVLATALR